MPNPHVAIVGAGITGLTSAWYLQKAGIRYELFDAADRVGGRARTESLEGYTLDVGFQVFLETYEELAPLLDIPALGLGHFQSGAIVYDGADRIEFANPLDSLSAIFKLTQPWGTLTDKAKIPALYLTQALGAEPFPPKGLTTADFLKAQAFSEQALHRLFRPFFGDVFLDRGLSPDANFFLYLLKKFALTKASLPARGMQDIATQIASKLNSSCIHLRNPVSDLAGLMHDYTHVLVTAPALLLRKPSTWHGTVNVYMAGQVDKNPGPILVLNAENRLLRNVCVISQAQPAYAPQGKDLVSVTLSSEAGTYTKEHLQDILRFKLTPWLGDTSGLQFLEQYHVPHSLPASIAPTDGKPYRQEGNIYYGGDVFSYPSLNGAAFSARHMVEHLLTTL